MNKKIIALITVLIVMSILVVGCGSGSKSSNTKFLGSWQDINTANRYAKIYSNTDGTAGYTWEDNEDKYPAHFDKGVLLVTVTKTQTAKVVYNKTDDHLHVTLANDKFEFKRK